METITMPNYIECLLGILRRSAIVPLVADGDCVVLKEKSDGGNSKTLTEVTVDGLPEHTVVIDADKLEQCYFETDGTIKGLRSTISKYRRKTDYVIVTEIDLKPYVIYCEMKTSPRSSDHIPQLRCGRAHVEHIVYLMRHFDKINAKFNHRFVKFTRIPLDKQESVIGDGNRRGAIHPNRANNEPCCAYSCNVVDGVPIDLRSLIYDPVNSHALLGFFKHLKLLKLLERLKP